MNNIEKFRKNASVESLGLSDPIIYEDILNILTNNSIQPSSLLDIGCGQGEFIKLLKMTLKECEVSGTDLTEFTDQDVYNFIPQDLNLDFNNLFKKYDLITAIEVIEHVENGRHFIRQIEQLLTLNGDAFISTPNTESWRSLISFFIRGYHVNFGPKNYPAHICSYTEFEIKNIIKETTNLDVVSVYYVKNGKIPSTQMNWANIIPFVNNKRFSDNFIVHFRKIK